VAAFDELCMLCGIAHVDLHQGPIGPTGPHLYV
jgi:hypothetical protein